MVFLWTNAKFLGNDYMMSDNVRSKVDLRDLDNTPITAQKTVDPVPTIPVSSTSVPCCSGRVVVQLD